MSDNLWGKFTGHDSFQWAVLVLWSGSVVSFAYAWSTWICG
ncbi:MAG: hypothetical protein ABIU96_04065 [Rhodanobacter sp.]